MMSFIASGYAAAGALRIGLGGGGGGPLAPESCDTIDNDCDGRTDEALRQVAILRGEDVLRGPGTPLGGEPRRCAAAGIVKHPVSSILVAARQVRMCSRVLFLARIRQREICSLRMLW